MTTALLVVIAKYSVWWIWSTRWPMRMNTSGQFGQLLHFRLTDVGASDRQRTAASSYKCGESTTSRQSSPLIVGDQLRLVVCGRQMVDRRGLVHLSDVLKAAAGTAVSRSGGHRQVGRAKVGAASMQEAASGSRSSNETFDLFDVDAEVLDGWWGNCGSEIRWCHYRRRWRWRYRQFAV